MYNTKHGRMGKRLRTPQPRMASMIPCFKIWTGYAPGLSLSESAAEGPAADSAFFTVQQRMLTHGLRHITIT